MQDVVIGQERAVQALSSSMRSDRLPHGMLFSGPVGVGKETCARALARGLLCELRGTKDPGRDVVPFGCGSCRACRRVESGAHPDLTVIMSEAEAVGRGLQQPEGKARPSPDIKVDAIRAFAQTLQKRPYEGKNRVAIVVDAHRMNTSAQNALLKGLEEPGPQTILMLLVPNARAVLPTIASRCLRLTFAPLAPEALERILVKKGVVDAAVRARSGVWSVPDALAASSGAASSGAGAQGGGAAAVGDDDDDQAALHRLLGALALRQRAGGGGDGNLHERLEAAAALGRDRAEVDGLLARCARQLARSLRARHLEGLALGDVDELSALEGIFAARRDLQMNGAVQLVIERLLLGTPPSILERHR